jgi:hypothetical protein
MEPPASGNGVEKSPTRVRDKMLSWVPAHGRDYSGVSMLDAPGDNITQVSHVSRSLANGSATASAAFPQRPPAIAWYIFDPAVMTTIFVDPDSRMNSHFVYPSTLC